MPSITPDDLKAALREVMEEKRRVSNDEHTEHHAWVRAQIDKANKRADFYANLASKSLPALVYTLIVAALGWIGTHVKWS